MFIGETNPMIRYQMQFSGGEVSDDVELERLPREQLDRVLESMSAQTGLEFAIEQREVTVWRLVTD